MSTQTRVVRLRKRKGAAVQGCDVYIGRQMNMGGWRLNESIYATPFKIDGKLIPDALSATMMYADWLHFPEQNHILKRLSELKGKSLGCWCKTKPESPCHGDVLAYLADGVISPSVEHILEVPCTMVTTSSINNITDASTSQSQNKTNHSPKKGSMKRGSTSDMKSKMHNSISTKKRSVANCYVDENVQEMKKVAI